MADLDQILSDLADEHAALDALVRDLSDAEWETQTPAEGWNIRDQVGHLAFFDEQAALALRDQAAFAATLEEIIKDVGAYMDRSVQKGRDLGNAGVLEWWRTARTDMLDASRGVEPGTRIPWYGPPMSPASFFSARIMETWAHAQDVADALGVKREVAPRIRHVAHLCVLSRRHSYAANALEMPDRDVRVELVVPNGDAWTWGEGTDDRVTGPVEDFCLVVTQRRHPDDTRLTIEGDAATEWMSVAQAYAGPPGKGRSSGQFPAPTS
jgi:uncharacterized protein (TIGR03084 family)